MGINWRVAKLGNGPKEEEEDEDAAAAVAADEKNNNSSGNWDCDDLEESTC